MTSPTPITDCERDLQMHPRTWLVTGVAGFIGSHLLEALLRLGQTVRGLDNFSTGSEENLAKVRDLVGPGAWRNFHFVEGDIIDAGAVREVVHGADVVLHQAALGSVPRSIKDPVTTNRSNIDGFLQVLSSAHDLGVRRFVYASSSSVYGDHPQLPKVEAHIGNPLSPYAVTKQVNELYGHVFASLFDMQTVGLRYFNVFGPRQNPQGPYAAVIPRWVAEQLAGEQSVIYGDGSTSRDFCFVRNVVDANLLAATVDLPTGQQVFNIALSGQTTLLELFSMIREQLEELTGRSMPGVRHDEFRPGDVKHSLADISRAGALLGYEGRFSLRDGMKETLRAYL